jgi:hypothetical protein
MSVRSTAQHLIGCAAPCSSPFAAQMHSSASQGLLKARQRAGITVMTWTVHVLPVDYMEVISMEQQQGSTAGLTSCRWQRV